MGVSSDVSKTNSDRISPEIPKSGPMAPRELSKASATPYMYSPHFAHKACSGATPVSAKPEKSDEISNIKRRNEAEPSTFSQDQHEEPEEPDFLNFITKGPISSF